MNRINDASHIAQLHIKAKTIAMASLLVLPAYDEIHITFAEVAKEFRGHAYNKQLLSGIFDYASRWGGAGNPVEIIVPGFTPKGERSLYPAMIELNAIYKEKGAFFDYDGPLSNIP